MKTNVKGVNKKQTQIYQNLPKLPKPISKIKNQLFDHQHGFHGFKLSINSLRIHLR